MSCYIVSKEHIDAMVTAWTRFGGHRAHISNDKATTLGAMLWAENHRSYNHRYSESVEPPAYTFRELVMPPGLASIVAVIKALHGYEYQACEHPEWPTSEAYALCRSIMRAVTSSLPGYDASAAWEIRDPDFFVRASEPSPAPEPRGKRSVGPKYEATQELSRTEIAKLIRDDIKGAIAVGTLPRGIKVSVKCSPRGSAIDLRITALPADFVLYTPEYVRGEVYRIDEIYSPEGQAMRKELEAILWSYNYDNSDAQIDHFDRRYYGNVSIAHDLEQSKLGEAKAAREVFDALAATSPAKGAAADAGATNDYAPTGHADSAWIRQNVSAAGSLLSGVAVAPVAQVATVLPFPTPPKPEIAQASQVFDRLAPRLGQLPQEVFVVLALGARNKLVGEEEVARGTLTHVEVHPRDVFRGALLANAAAIIVAHNHPSGDPTPSPADLDMTERLRACGELLGIPVLDHVIVTAAQYHSMAQHGQLRAPGSGSVLRAEVQS